MSVLASQSQTGTAACLVFIVHKVFLCFLFFVFYKLCFPKTKMFFGYKYSVFGQ